MLIKFLGTDKYLEVNNMLNDLEEDDLDKYRLARMVVIEKGSYLFSGSNNNIRGLRSFLLKQLDNKTLSQLYGRNPIGNRKIQSAECFSKKKVVYERGMA